MKTAQFYAVCYCAFEFVGIWIVAGAVVICVAQILLVMCASRMCVLTLAVQH